MYNGDSELKLPMNILPPSYSTLVDWWKAWPQAKPELLDFWARGNFTRRLISRNTSHKSACIIGVDSLYETEDALKRLALLDLDLDFAWHGEVSKPVMTFVPQAMDYGDSGGWGYITCVGDEIINRKSKKEWCPAIGWASLLPDNIVDWMASDAKEFLNSGRIIVAPAKHIGLVKNPYDKNEKKLQELSNSISITRENAKIKSIFNIELPYLDNMPIQDIYKFTIDYKDSLCLFQNALNDLIREAPENIEDNLAKDLVSQINQGVAELRLSSKTHGARKLLSNIGASISILPLGIVIGLQLSQNNLLNPITAATTLSATAVQMINLYSQILKSRGQMRKNPFYAIWALQKRKGPKNKFSQRNNNIVTNSQKSLWKGPIPQYHWMSPPTAGWLIPSYKTKLTL
jgi:hypothetical protein